MKPNIGDGERLIRVILGIYAMLVGFLFIQGVVGIILGILGLIAFATGATGWCGIYALMGKSTLKVAPAEPESASPEPEQPASENAALPDQPTQ
jgi:hypothetical protein